MKLTKRILTLLLALIVTLAFMPAAVYADGSSSTDDNGLVLDKTINSTGDTITLESYVTGNASITTNKKPVHIVLVLDVSGSMSDSIPDGTSYTASNGSYTYSKVTSNSYYYLYDGKYYKVHGVRNAHDWKYYYRYWLYFDTDDGTRYYLKGNSVIQAQNQTNPTYDGKEGTKPKDINGNDIDPVEASLLDSNPTVWKGTLYTQNGKTTKIAALKTAATNFVDAVAADATANNLEHQISIVKYASSASTVKGLTSVNNSSNVTSLKSSISGLSANGATGIDYGMAEAYSIVNADTSDANKVVVVFTDGCPTHGSADDDWSNDNEACAVANIAIGGTAVNGYSSQSGYGDKKSAHDIKNLGATIWTVGLFPDDVSDIQSKFMNYMSSNYPDATSLSSGGTQADTKYFMNSKTSDELNAVFDTISSEVIKGGAAMTDLGTDAVVQDKMSEYFDLNVTDTNKVKVYTSDYTGENSWGEKVDITNDVTITTNSTDGTVRVTGFDLSANWCGTTTKNGTTTYQGKKLIIEIPVEENGTGVDTVPTNTKADTAVYKGDGTKVEEFPLPTWYIPYFEVKYSTGYETGKLRIDSVPSTGYDATAGVKDGYLYGGLYDSTYATAKTDECGKTLRPDDKDVFYVKEVSDKYLQPKQLTLEAQNKIQSTYFLTTVDTVNFKEVGFEVTDGTNTLTKIAGNGATKLSVLADGASESTDKCAVANQVTAKLTNGDIVTINMANMIGSGYAGYVAAAGITYDNDNADMNVTNEKIGAGTYTVLPYWVTPDGVKVTGVQKRTLQYTNGNLDAESVEGDGTTTPTNPVTTARETVASVTSVYEPKIVIDQVSLLLVNTMSAAGTDGNSSLEGDELLAGTIETADEAEEPVTVTAPAKVTLKSVKAGKKSLTVSWKSVKNANGYQVKYKKTGTDTWKYVYVKSSVTSKKLSKLAAGKKYTVKVRAYKTYTNEDGKTCKKFGKYSSVKTVKTLK